MADGKQTEIQQRIAKLEADMRAAADYVLAAQGGMVERVTLEQLRFRQLFEIVKLMAGEGD